MGTLVVVVVCAAWSIGSGSSIAFGSADSRQLGQPPSGKIAFESNAGRNTEIFVIEPDGSGRRQLTHNPSFDTDPAFSPDGQQIAFVREQRRSAEIFVMNADGTDVHRLTRKGGASALDPAFSNAGNRIVFSASRRNDYSEIFTMRVDGRGRRRLTDNRGNDWSASYTADDSAIVFERVRNNGDIGVSIMSATGAESVDLTTAPTDDFSAWPDASPASDLIVYTRFVDFVPEIFVMNPDGSDQRNISNRRGWDAGPSFSPDGTQVAYGRNRGGPRTRGGIFIIDVDGTGAHKIPHTSWRDAVPDWGPDPK